MRRLQEVFRLIIGATHKSNRRGRFALPSEISNTVAAVLCANVAVGSAPQRECRNRMLVERASLVSPRLSRESLCL